MVPSGESYVVFGTDLGFGATFDLSSLDGSSGFVINGIDAGDSSGYAVNGIGDVNGDGFDDIIIGAPQADPDGLGTAGESYVVFGTNAGFDAVLELSSLDGSNGFVLKGVEEYDFSGYAVNGIGDINGDGFDDLVVSAKPSYYPDLGAIYVVLGDASFDAAFDLNRSNFVLRSFESYDYAGRSVSGAGDINGDGFDDLIIGASGVYEFVTEPNGDVSYINSRGESYVVFGDADFSASPKLIQLRW